MVIIKSYTDIEQSKKLAVFLPIESADYCWGIDDETLHYNNSPYPCAWKDYTCKEYYIPCWSLAALLGILKDKIIFGGNSPEGWFCCYTIKNPTKTLTIYEDSLVDACVDAIEKLHKLNLL